MTDVENEKRKDGKGREDGKRRQHEDIRVGTLNITSGRGNRLEMVCKKLQRHEIDICMLTNTKLCVAIIRSNQVDLMCMQRKSRISIKEAWQ